MRHRDGGFVFSALVALPSMSELGRKPDVTGDVAVGERAMEEWL